MKINVKHPVYNIKILKTQKVVFNTIPSLVENRSLLYQCSFYIQYKNGGWSFFSILSYKMFWVFVQAKHSFLKVQQWRWELNKENIYLQRSYKCQTCRHSFAIHIDLMKSRNETNQWVSSTFFLRWYGNFIVSCLQMFIYHEIV